MPSPKRNEQTGPGGEIRVSFHSGYKAEETPRALFISGREFLIEKVLERKRIRNRDSGETFDLFVCRVAGKKANIRMDKSGHCGISPLGTFEDVSKTGDGKTGDGA
jgi:hypothetical protein